MASARRKWLRLPAGAPGGGEFASSGGGHAGGGVKLNMGRAREARFAFSQKKRSAAYLASYLDGPSAWGGASRTEIARMHPGVINYND